MKEILGRIICAVIFLCICLIVINKVDVNVIKCNDISLVIYGDNINTSEIKDGEPARKPFVDENGGIYLAFNTIYNFIDENIFYDKVATKVIITTDNQVIKMKLDENKMSVNLEDKEITTPVKIKDGIVYVDINLLKDVYNIYVDYNEKNNVITIDKKEVAKSSIKYNKVNVYSDLKTKSDVVSKLSKGSNVIVYDKSLQHNRWYKIKTDDGTIGYISKNNVSFVDNINANIENEEKNEMYSKYVMFWQYGSDLKTLGNKIEGVNVVSPTWFELSNSSGDISSKYNSMYHSIVKSYGYEVWPIITNGIDSASYTPEDTSAMLNSELSRERFITNLLNICKTNNFDGINMDFEAMKTEDRDLYTQLIREMAPLFRVNNIKVSVDTYFVEYIDRKGIGEAADYVILMGYDQRGGWSSVTGSISEISWVENNIKSLINDSKIPSNKIILGIPFYTRLWIQKNGEEKPTTKVYTMEDCEDFISLYNLTKSYDENSGQNYVERQKGNLTYKLWIEDETSIKNRVDIVNKYNLAGISAWRKGFETNNTWNIITSNIVK